MNINLVPPVSDATRVHIGSKDRRKIGIDNSRIATSDNLHQRADFVAKRNLLKADLFGDCGHPAFVIAVAIAMR